MGNIHVRRRYGYVPGTGEIKTITGTDPAAGAEISETVPAGKVWRVRSLVMQIDTDATVIGRRPMVVFDDGTDIYAAAAANGDSANDTDLKYQYGIGLSPLTTTGQGFVQPLPDVIMPAGHRLRTVTGNLQAGDDYDAPILQVEEWPE